jgi:hypothetical protein
MGDFNAQIGTRKKGEESILGQFCRGKRTRNGEKLINLAHEQNLVILNTLYKKKEKSCWTWLSPDGRYKNVIDYILTNRSRSFEDCSVVASLNFNTNHRMVRARLKPITPKPTRKFVHQYKETTDQKSQITADQLKQELNHLQGNLSEDNIPDTYNKLTEVINKCKRTRDINKKGKDLLSEETKQLMQDRAEMIQSTPKTAELRKEITQISKLLRQNMRKDRQQHRRKTLQDLIATTGGTKKAIKILQEKEEWIPKLKDSTGNDRTRRIDIISTATDFYKDLYSNPDASEYIDLPDTSEVPPILECEVEKSISSQKINKASGPDNISNETLIETKEHIAPTLTQVFNMILKKEMIPKQWTVSTIKLLHKKGDKNDIGNYRPISLMSNIYKTFSKIILHRITKILDENQPVEQAGFRSNYSAVDHIHAVRQIIEKCKEYNITFYCCFVDYCKAFDSLLHIKIWEALKRQGVEHKYIRLIRNIYTNTTARIKLEREGEDIKIQRGVRQGDPLSPKLFTAVLEEVFKKMEWMNYGMRINGVQLTHLRFADDIVVFATSAEDLQEMLEDLDRASKEVGLSMNVQKTKAMSNANNKTIIRLNNNIIEYVPEYLYLGQIISPHESTAKEIDRRIGNAWKRYWSMKEIMKNTQFSTSIKRKLFNTCILPIFTYGCETWALTKAQCKKLKVSQRAMERSILKKRRLDKIKNSELRDKTKLEDVAYKVKHLKWKWAGHTIRGPEKWSKILTTWYPRGCKRKRGRQFKRWEDEIIEMAGKTWTRVVTDREKWRRLGEAFASRHTEM